MTLVLKAVSNNYRTYGGFQWNVTPNGVTTAPDFDPDPTRVQGGGGLYGFKEGVGDSKFANLALDWAKRSHYTYHGRDMDWIVVDVDEPLIEMGGQVRFASAKTVFVSDRNKKSRSMTMRSQAANFLLAHFLDEQGDNTTGYTGFTFTRPIMHLDITVNKLPTSNDSPYYNSNKDVWLVKYFDKFANESVLKEYVFDQYEFVFGDGTTLNVGLHGTNYPAGNKWTVGDYSNLDIHAHKSIIVGGDNCSADVALALEGYDCEITLGRFGFVNTTRNTVINVGDYSYIRDTGTGRLTDVHTEGMDGVTATCGDYCKVILAPYSTLVAGNRCNISARANCVIEAGVGCDVSIFGSDYGVVPTRPPAKVKAKRGTTVTYTPDPDKPQETFQWIVGIQGVKEDVFYRIVDGKIVDDQGNVVPQQQYLFNARAGVPATTEPDATGKDSFFYNIEENVNPSSDRSQFDLEKKLTGKWKKYFKDFDVNYNKYI